MSVWLRRLTILVLTNIEVSVKLFTTLRFIILPYYVLSEKPLGNWNRQMNTFTPKMFGPGKERELGEPPARTALTANQYRPLKMRRTRYIRTVPSIRRNNFVSNVQIR